MIHRRVLVLAALALATSLPGCSASDRNAPECSRTDRAVFILQAQAVPSATRLPCITGLSAGWTYGGSQIQSGRVRFWLDSDRAGLQAVRVDLTRTCSTTGAVEVPAAPDEVGFRVLQRPTSLPPNFTGERFIEFPGGCITYSYRFRAGASSTLVLEADDSLATVPRDGIVQRVRRDLGLNLCGAGAPPCVGSRT